METLLSILTRAFARGSVHEETFADEPSPVEIAEDGPEVTFESLGISADLVAVTVANGETVPPYLVEQANAHHIALFSSAQPSPHLVDVFRLYLSRMLAEVTTLHGVFLDVLEMGVLITGASAIGKSELALELISRGNGLIADDIVEIYRISPDTLEGRCPGVLRDFLEVRGLGVLNIRSIFGECLRQQLTITCHATWPRLIE
mgnify:CR=1 FL=1